jgi:hypothetical protein
MVPRIKNHNWHTHVKDTGTPMTLELMDIQWAG